MSKTDAREEKRSNQSQGNRVVHPKWETPDGRKERWRLEFPGGAIESGETPEQAAVRELAEEVGLRADRLPLLCEVQVEGILHYIFSTHLHEHERPKPDNEIAACKWVLRSSLDRTELKSSAAALVATRLPLLCP